MVVEMPFYGKAEQIDKLVAEVAKRMRTIYGDDTTTSFLSVAT